MEHAGFDELWSDLVEGTLSESDAQALRNHLATCRACSEAYRVLESAHRVSLQVGREAASGTGHMPPHLRERVLAKARDAAARRPRRRVWSAVAAAAALAAAAVLVVRVRNERETAREELLLRASLAGLMAADVRGRADPLAEAAALIHQGWDNGSLRMRHASVACPGGYEFVAALVSSAGTVELLAMRSGNLTELRVYRPDGTEAGAARVISGARVPYVLAPLSQAAARASVENPTCRASRLRGS